MISMKLRSQPDNAPSGPYDPAQPDDDLWFLPADDPDAGDAAPLPRADRTPLIDPRAWQAAQGDLSAGLARLAMLAGALDERLRQAPQGWRQRLALVEAADLSWWVGDRVAPEKLALRVALRQGGTGDEAQAIGRAAWAVRRLTGGAPPSQDWGAFLGRDGDGIADLAALADDLAALHPVVRAAALFTGWRMLGTDGPVRETEAAVLAARVAAEGARGGLVFLPLAMTGFSAARSSGRPVDRLGAWLAGAERATLAALLHLDRLRDWRGRAEAALSDLQGRTPARLLQVLTDWPLVDAPMAETLTGAGRATVQRNLHLMQERGLIREVTGQGRYRLWTLRHV